MEILGTRKEKSRVYLAVLSLAVIGLALIFSTWQTLRRQREASVEHLELTSSAVLQAVESSLRRNPGMGANMVTPGTREFFRDLENSGDVIFIGVLDEDGARILSDGENAPRSFRLPPEALSALKEKTRWQGEATYGGKAIYVALRPVTFQPMRHHGRGPLVSTLPPPPPRFLMVGVDMDKHFAVYHGFKRTAMFQTAYILTAALLLWVLAARFISRRQLAGKAAYLERFQARLVDSLPDALLITEAATGQILAANPAAHALFHETGSLAGKNSVDIGLPVAERRSGQTAGWTQAALGGTHLEMRTLPFQGEDGAESLMVIIRDRTEIRTLEKNLAEAEKLAAIGSLAAGVAHEIRNPLSALRGFAQYFAKKLAGREPEEEYANTMVREADRLNRVVTDLLYLARPSHLAVTSTDLNAACDETASLLQFELRDLGIGVVKHLDVPVVSADPDGLKQILLNLFLNAIEAMRNDPGTLSISSERGVHNSENGVWVRVADTGPGMAEDVRARAFEPFLTTKEKGTGLGLALTHAIMRAHGGDAAIVPPLSDNSASPSHAAGCVVALFFPDRPIDAHSGAETLP